MTVSKKGNQTDILFGLFLVVLASIVLIEIRELASGTAAEMGPGYIPRALASVLLISGIGYTVYGFLQKLYISIPSIQWKSVIFVILSIASFAFTLEFLGLFGATILMTIFAALANKETRWAEMIIFAICLAAFTVIVFIFALSLPLPIWPAFIG